MNLSLKVSALLGRNPLQLKNYKDNQKKGETFNYSNVISGQIVKQFYNNNILM